MPEAAKRVKAYLRSELSETFEFLFNPAELVVSRAVSWDAPTAKGKNTSLLSFQQGRPATLSFTAMFDTTKDGSDVTVHTNGLLALMDVDERLRSTDRQRNQARPPWVTFGWGGLQSFRAVLENASITYTYFSPSGTPLRASADLTLKQYEDDTSPPLQNPTSGTPAPHRTHRVRRGETLDRIAAVHYGDPTRWRALADANGVDDAFSVPPGTELVVPEREVGRRGR